VSPGGVRGPRKTQGADSGPVKLEVERGTLLDSIKKDYERTRENRVARFFRFKAGKTKAKRKRTNMNYTRSRDEKRRFGCNLVSSFS